MAYTTSQSRRPLTPVRYIVQYWDGPDVSYNCGLGTVNARRWATYNARVSGGQVLVEYSDGSIEVVRSYGGAQPAEAAA